jgi:hypothetical protein
MKIIASTCLSLILLGCSPDAVDMPEANVVLYKTKKASTLPANSVNNNDHTGAIYYRILDAYYALPQTAVNLGQLITLGDSLAFHDPGFLALPDLPPHGSVSVSDVEMYTGSPESDIAVLLTPGYGSKSRAVFGELTSGLSQLKNDNATFDEAYYFIAALEGTIIDNPSLSQEEQDAILVTTSLLRYGLYHDKKRKRRDRDWDWMTTAVAATANAALESEAKAILISFATDVYIE